MEKASASYAALKDFDRSCVVPPSGGILCEQPMELKIPLDGGATQQAVRWRRYTRTTRLVVLLSY